MKSPSNYISYITRNKLHVRNDYIKSLIEQYNTKKRLSEKQTRSLVDIQQNHYWIQCWFWDNESKVSESPFLQSLKNFFDTRGYLSPKQSKHLI